MKVLVFGALNVDHVYLVDHFVKPGETLSSEDLQFFPGGKGLNQAAAFSKSGAETYMAGIVGKDGEELLFTALHEAGADTSLVKILDAPSGHAIIQNTKAGDNNILLFGGTNQMIDEAYADEVLSRFESGDVIVLQNEISALPYIMEQAHRKGMKIVLNPSPADEKIQRLPLEFADVLVVNEVEGEMLTGISPKKPELMLKTLMERFYASEILLTLGEQGSMYGCRDTVVSCPACSVHVVDTTAAGDTFTGYFISERLRGKAPEEALKTASFAASIAVSRKGASVSVPFREEVETSL